MKPYSIDRTSAYKREYRKMAKRGYDMAELDYVVTLLATRQSLSSKYKDHALAGNWKGFRECHISPDWLLIYKIEANVLILTLQRTGTHSDLF